MTDSVCALCKGPLVEVEVKRGLLLSRCDNCTTPEKEVLHQESARNATVLVKQMRADMRENPLDYPAYWDDETQAWRDK